MASVTSIAIKGEAPFPPRAPLEDDEEVEAAAVQSVPEALSLDAGIKTCQRLTHQNLFQIMAFSYDFSPAVTRKLPSQ